MEEKRFRFGDFIGESSVSYSKISFNELAPKAPHTSGGELIPYKPPQIQVNTAEAVQILAPFISVRILEQMKSVVPLALFMAGFQVLILRMSVDDPLIISIGFFLVIVGLMLFLEGIKHGLTPFAETIGDLLPKKSPLWIVLAVVFSLGMAVALAEPAMGALKAAGSIINVQKAPYLYAMLNYYTGWMALVVGAGVGLASAISALRFLYGWSLKPFIYLVIGAALWLTWRISGDPALAPILGLAWDCGAITTGPVTVPIVLALGIGISSSAGKGGDAMAGFGIVTMASSLPVVGIQLLGLHVAHQLSPAAIMEMAAAARASQPGFLDMTPISEILMGLRAIAPLILFLWIILRYIVRENVRGGAYLTLGLILSAVGLIAFNIGLSYGLVKLGAQAGALLPSAFARVENVAPAPLYNFYVGLSIALLFAWLLGYSATMAEPALAAMGATVENLTNGAFNKKMLLYSVASGVAFGVTLGLVKIVFHIPLGYLLIPSYIISLVLTYLSGEELVNIAWDCAGVTTGPVTVPVVLAIGLGFGEAMNAIDGFGILAMASVAPIISVLGMGMLVNRKVAYSHEGK